MAIHVFGAIDVGSYELGLKIFEVSRSKGIRQIDHLERRIDLGSDTYTTGKLSYLRVRQTAQVLTEFRKIMDMYKVEAYQAYGTSAIREMSNASLVLEQWEQASGIHVDVISNEEQRFLDYKAIATRSEGFLRMTSDSCAIVDIGGGSVQISLFDKDTLRVTQNLPLGVLRIHDMVSRMNVRVSKTDSLTEEIVNASLGTFCKLYLGQEKIHNIIVVDDYISSVMQSRKQEFLEASMIKNIVREARDKGTYDLARRLGVTDATIPLLYVSGVLLRCIIKAFDAQLIWAPGITLCDGIVYEYAEKHRILQSIHNFENDILLCAHNISRRYMGSEEHSSTLENIAVNIFAATRKKHGLGKREELLLRIAAILSVCGSYISVQHQSWCAYNIVMATEIIGISQIEREVIANVVRFMNEDFIYYEEQEDGSDIDRDAYMTITKLTAILRLASSLDRSNKRKFGDLRINVKDERMIVSTKSTTDITLEANMFSRHADFFEEVLGLRPMIKQRQ